MSSAAGRVVEVDLANERVILATTLKAPETARRIIGDLRPDDFGDPRHRVLFRALSLLVKRGLAYSEDTLAELCKGEEFGGFQYLRTLEREYQPTVNVDFHLERLRLDAVKLTVLDSDLPAIASACEDPTASPERISQIMRAALGRVERIGRRFETSGDDLVDGYYETLRLRRAVGGVVDGFGFRILDSVLTRGFAPGGMSAIVARPGVGKTTLLANLIRHRVRTGRGTYVGAWEMMKEDYLDMLVSAETGIASSILSNAVASLTDEDALRVQEAVERYRESDLIVFQENPFTKLERPTDRWADINQRNLDYFESVVAEQSKTKTLFALDVIGKLLHDRRPDNVTSALVRLGEIAKAYHVHILSLHHLNRDGAGGRPTLENIKNSGAFEEEMDNVFGLDRPILRATPARKKKMADVMDLYVLKQRKGPASICVRYRFDGARYALTHEVEVDISMLESDDDDSRV